MFSTKSKPFAAPAVLKPNNSGNKFISEFKSNGQNSLNRSFDTAKKFHDKTTTTNLKQTKLCQLAVKRQKIEEDENSNSGAESKGIPPSKKETKTEFFLLPVPKTTPKEQPYVKANLNKTIGAVVPCNLHQRNEQQANVREQPNPLEKNGRNLVSLVGRVDFCLKKHKTHPEVNAVWVVYGKLQKIIVGKYRSEHILLLRSETGPILQSVYYDFNNILQQFRLGCYLRVVGRFIGSNRLQTFKVEEVNEKSWEEKITRIQNVQSFVMLQNNVQSGAK